MYKDDVQTYQSNLKFFRRLMKFAVLSPTREKALVEGWYRYGKLEALHQLICAYERLVMGISLQFARYNLPLADLVQEGNVGLLQAALRFDPARNLRFITYASWWVRATIQDYVLRNWSIVRVGTTASQKKLFFSLRALKRRIGALSSQPLNEDMRQKLANEFHLSLRDIELIDLRLTYYDHSLNAPLSGGGDSLDLLLDGMPSPEGQYMHQELEIHRSAMLQQALQYLTPREQEVIHVRQLQERPYTLRQAAAELGISKERVRQLEIKAISKMKNALLQLAPHPQDLF